MLWASVACQQPTDGALSGSSGPTRWRRGTPVWKPTVPAAAGPELGFLGRLRGARKDDGRQDREGEAALSRAAELAEVGGVLRRYGASATVRRRCGRAPGRGTALSTPLAAP